MRNPFISIGQTSDGKSIVAGVYWLYSDTGIPLDVVFDICNKKNMIPSWICLYLDAWYNGVPHDRLLLKIQEPIADVYGMEFSNVVIEYLNNIFDGFISKLVDVCVVKRGKRVLSVFLTQKEAQEIYSNDRRLTFTIQKAICNLDCNVVYPIEEKPILPYRITNGS